TYGYHCNNFVFESYFPDILETCFVTIPDVPRAALVTGSSQGFFDWLSDLYVSAIVMDVRYADKTAVRRAEKRDMETWIYTVNDERDLKRAHHVGAHAVFTDYPDRIRQFLSSF
ncbi:hypothetical protein L0Y49_01585, partial [bacterium]|nr:hypothetical protein [bacterium]